MKKIISFILSFVLVSTLFIGCTVKSNQPEVDMTVVNENGKSNEGNEKDVQPKPFEGQVLRVLSHDNVYARSLRNLADDFKEKTGATLELDPVGQQIMEQRIQLDFAGGTGSVDVAYMPLIFTSKWASAGWVQPIDEFVKRDEEEVDMNDFVASAVDALRYDDNLYGLPGFAETGMMAYRTDVLEEHGFNEPPKTWKELLEVCEAIDSDDMSAIAMRSQRGQGLNMFVFPMFMWGYNGSFFEDFPKDMTPNIDTPENLEALEVYTKFISEYSPSGGGNFSYPDIISAMQAGNTAIIIDGTSILGAATSAENNQYSDKIKLALIPEGPGGSSPPFAVHGWAIPTFAKNQELAWEFIKWATSSEVQKMVAMGEGGEVYLDFTRESVGNDPEVLEKYSTMNIAALRNEALKTTQWDYRPLMNEWAEIGDVFASYVNSAVNRQITPKEALEGVEADIYDILEKAGYEVE